LGGGVKCPVSRVVINHIEPKTMNRLDERENPSNGGEKKRMRRPGRTFRERGVND